MKNIDKNRKLKIAILVRRFVTTGGLERYAVEVTRRLSLNHEVHVFTQEWHDLEGYENITIHKIPKVRKPSFLNMLVFSYFTAKAIDNTFDVVHSHERVLKFDVLTIHVPCFKSFITQEQRIWKRIILWSGVILSPRKIVYLLMEKKQFSLNKNKLLIAVSKKTKINVQNNYFLPDSFFRLSYPGVDANFSYKKLSNDERDQNRFKIGIRKADLVVLFVGTEFKRKGLDALMKGFALIKHINAKLLIVGGGKQEYYRALAQELDIESDVIFLGLVNDISSIYAISDIFILPTISDPAAMSPLEAMASGVATIMSSSKYNGCAEHISNKESIILENPESEKEISEALLKLSDPSYRMQLAVRAKDLVLQLGWDKTVSQTLNAYYEVLDCKKNSQLNII